MNKELAVLIAGGYAGMLIKNMYGIDNTQDVSPPAAIDVPAFGPMFKSTTNPGGLSMTIPAFYAVLAYAAYKFI